MRVPSTALLSVAAAAMALLGCTTATSLNTTSIDVSTSSGLVNGTYYYVPQGTVVITGLIEPTDRDLVGQPTVHKGDFTLTVSVDLRPDPAMRFFFKPDENFLLDSDTRLVVNDKALLDTVTAATLNKGVPAALTIAQMAPTPLDFGAQAADEAPFTYRFDPFDAAQVAAVERALDQHQGIRLRVTPSVAPGKGDSKEDPKDAGNSGNRYATATAKYSGVLFRPVVPLTLSFRSEKAALGDQQVLLCVPDKRSLLAFDLQRGVFIDKAVELQFHDGVLVSSHIGKPGLVTSLVNIPLQMIHTVFTGGI